MITTGLITFFVTTIVGAIFKLIATKMENTRMLEEAKLKALNAQAKVVDKARTFNNEGFMITRRIIAISAVIVILVIPIISPLIAPFIYPNMVVAKHFATWFGYDVVKSGFWPFYGSTTVTVWKQMSGIVITPAHWNLMNAIIGMYFGTSITKR